MTPKHVFLSACVKSRSLNDRGSAEAGGVPPHGAGAEDGGGLLGARGGAGFRGDLLPRAQGHPPASLQGGGGAVLEAVLGLRGGGRGIEGGHSEDGTCNRRVIKCFLLLLFSCGLFRLFWA